MNPDEQAIREQVAQRSRLRMANFLPELDVKYEVAMAMGLARRHAYEALADQHAEARSWIRGEVLAEQRAKRGDRDWPHTGGGHGIVHLLTQKRFSEYLAKHGIDGVAYPVRRSVLYGSDGTG